MTCPHLASSVTYVMSLISMILMTVPYKHSLTLLHKQCTTVGGGTRDHTVTSVKVKRMFFVWQRLKLVKGHSSTNTFPEHNYLISLCVCSLMLAVFGHWTEDCEYEEVSSIYSL